MREEGVWRGATAAPLTAIDLKEHFVVETQPELWHAGEDHLQLDTAHDLAAQDTAVGVHLGHTGGGQGYRMNKYEGMWGGQSRKRRRPSTETEEEKGGWVAVYQKAAVNTP